MPLLMVCETTSIQVPMRLISSSRYGRSTARAIFVQIYCVDGFFSVHHPLLIIEIFHLQILLHDSIVCLRDD